MRIVLLVGAAVLVGLFAVSADDGTNAKKQQTLAAANNANDNDRQGSQSHSEGHWKNPDHCFATCVAYGNQIEVATARIASQKSQNSEVKKFAEMMIRDHEQFLHKLEKYSPEATRNDALASSSSSRTSNQSGIQQTAGTESKDKTSVRTADNRSERDRDSQHALKIAQIEKELAEQCLSSVRRKLESKSGQEFDKCYMHAQIAAHEMMKDKLMVFQKHAGSDLSSILSDGLKTTEQHLAKAEEIAKSLDHGSTK